VGGPSRILRYRSISVQLRALLPATCTTWFLSTCVDILVPNSWFGYRCRLLCSSSLLLCLCCTSSMLSWYRDYADSSAVFSSFHGIAWLSLMLQDAWLQVLDANLGQGNYCASENGLIVTHLLPLAKSYNRVCSVIMFTSFNSSIKRSQDVISSNTLRTLVFERQFFVSRLSQLIQVGILFITIQ